MTKDHIMVRQRNHQLDALSNRQFYRPEMRRFEQFGAHTMSFFGHTKEIATAILTGTPREELHVSRLRMNAYGRHSEQKVARMFWGTIGAAALTAALIGGERVANAFEDNFFACSGETTVTLSSDRTLTDLAENIPRHNTTIGAVINNIASHNVGMVGTDNSLDAINPDDATPGNYTVATECDSLLPY